MCAQPTPIRSLSNSAADAEGKARTDLAAAHRLAAHFGWANMIYNHITLRVPGEPDHFLMKRDELAFDEVTASNLIKLDMEGNPVDPAVGPVGAGYTLHTAILKARPDVNCVAHVHTQHGMAMSAHKVGLRPINQDAMHFFNRIAYHDYAGLAAKSDRRDALPGDLGPHNAMIMRNHGLITCGDTPARAIVGMKYLIESCETQLMLEATGAEIIVPPDEVCERAAQQWDTYYAKGGHARAWAGLLRKLDRIDPSFRD